jgi:hypothetical protein
MTMILYLKNLEKSTKKLLDIINTFSKEVGHKINLQNSVVFLYTNNEQTEIEFRKAIPFTVASKKITHLGINLTKGLKDLYNKNCKPLKKESEERYYNI